MQHLNSNGINLNQNGGVSHTRRGEEKCEMEKERERDRETVDESGARDKCKEEVREREKKRESTFSQGDYVANPKLLRTVRPWLSWLLIALLMASGNGCSLAPQVTNTGTQITGKFCKTCINKTQQSFNNVWWMDGGLQSS